MSKIEDVILFQIDQASKAAKQYSQKEFDKLGINVTIEQWVILKVVSEHPALTQKELATKTFRDPASITRTLDLLEKKGYLMREKIPNNRRSYHINLTSSGEKFIAANMDMIRSHRQNSTKGFSSEELKQFSAFLLRVKANVS